MQSVSGVTHQDVPVPGSDAREKLEHWRRDYNEHRPHSALDDHAPAEFLRTLGWRPFALPIVSQASPPPRQGYADARPRPPALDPAAPLPGEAYRRVKGLAESPPLLARVK
jgi:hypothetical protein